MSRNLKKIGSSGRFGARYGIRARKRIAGIEKGQRKAHICPQCNHVAVKRVSSGIWMCRHCDLKFAGGAYRPRTESRRRSSFSFSSTAEKETKYVSEIDREKEKSTIEEDELSIEEDELPLKKDEPGIEDTESTMEE